MHDQQTLYTVEEAAQELRVSPDTIRRLLRDHKMIGVRVGGQWRLPAEALHSARFPIGAILNEQVETLTDRDVNGVVIPAGTLGYVIRHSTGVGGCYLNTITVCQTPMRPYGQHQVPEFDLNMAELNATWKFVPNDVTSPSMTIPRPLLHQFKDMLNQAYLADTAERKDAIIKQLYTLITIVLGKDDRSDGDEIANAIQAEMEALVGRVFRGA